MNNIFSAIKNLDKNLQFEEKFVIFKVRAKIALYYNIGQTKVNKVASAYSGITADSM